MPDTLIKKILLQANNPDATFENMPDLNALLQTKATVTWVLFWSSISGGLGRVYQDISTFLTLNKEGVITALNNEDKLVTTAGMFCDNAVLEKNKTAAYQAGILFALIAVYVPDTLKKIDAYKKLGLLFEPSGLLNDAEMLALCNEFLNPISLCRDFYPLNKILWSWELNGKDRVLKFEAKRHELLLGSTPDFSIKSALLLLGLTYTKLSKKQIIDASDLCHLKLKAIANLDTRAVRTNSLFKHFKEAKDLLILYVQFKQTNFDEKYLILQQHILLAKNTDISNTDIFGKTYSLFIEIDSNIKTLIPMAKEQLPYITNQMITEILGPKDALFAVEHRLQSMAMDYWTLISAKINSLLKRASALEKTSGDLSQSIDFIKQVCSEIEKALEVMMQIEGSALEESNVVSIEANDVNIKRTDLSFYLHKLEDKIAGYAKFIKASVESIIRLNQTLDKAEVDTTGVTDVHIFIRDQNELLCQIDKKLSWLRELNAYAKPLANSEFQKYILSQATLDFVIGSVADELNKLDKEVCAKALKFYLGPRNYNPNIPLRTTLMTYFRSKKNSNFKEIAVDLINELKEGIQEQQDLSVLISAKGLVPEPIPMTLEACIQNLEAKKVTLLLSVKTSSDQLNRDLCVAIKLIIKQQEDLFLEPDKIIAEQNSVTFSWNKRMAQFLQHEQALQKDLERLKRKWPDFTHRINYIDPALVTSLNILQKQQIDLDIKVDNMKKSLGNASYNVFQYRCLKTRLEQEKKVYLEQGKHDKARYESLKNLWSEIERIDSSNSDNPLLLLINAVQQQIDSTAKSHQKIGFLGAYRPSRLQIMYSKIMNESLKFHLSECVESAKSSLSLDTLKYSLLKNYIIRQGDEYQYSGKHHQDRKNSLNRLFQKLKDLDTSSQEDRFAALISTVQEEEKATVQSHLKVGFFGNWRPSRLQTIYGQILAMGSVCEKVSFETSDLNTDESIIMNKRI